MNVYVYLFRCSTQSKTKCVQYLNVITCMHKYCGRIKARRIPWTMFYLNQKWFNRNWFYRTLELFSSSKNTTIEFKNKKKHVYIHKYAEKKQTKERKTQKSNNKKKTQIVCKTFWLFELCFRRLQTVTPSVHTYTFRIIIYVISSSFSVRTLYFLSLSHSFYLSRLFHLNFWH